VLAQNRLISSCTCIATFTLLVSRSLTISSSGLRCFSTRATSFVEHASALPTYVLLAATHSNSLITSQLFARSKIAAAARWRAMDQAARSGTTC
jgi:hypothetical protein